MASVCAAVVTNGVPSPGRASAQHSGPIQEEVRSTQQVAQGWRHTWQRARMVGEAAQGDGGVMVDGRPPGWGARPVLSRNTITTNHRTHPTVPTASLPPLKQLLGVGQHVQQQPRQPPLLLVAPLERRQQLLAERRQPPVVPGLRPRLGAPLLHQPVVLFTPAVEVVRADGRLGLVRRGRA